MLRTCVSLAALSGLFAILAQAQGLNTNVSKDDWEEINFEFNTAVLSDGYPSLLRLADLLSKHAGYHVKLEGNTDNIGSTSYNEKLGLARANTVRDFLVKYGAKSGQIETTTRGKSDPRYSGFKNRYSKTDVARWMNRRVVVTVTDEQGRTVSAGGVGEAIQAMAPAAAAEPQKCCDDILKRLDKLDDIARMLKDLADQNANLRKDLDNLKNEHAALENKIAGLPKPLNEEQTGQVVDARLEKARDPRFALLGINIGADDHRDLTFSGKARYFAPFKEHFAVQAQGEYLYFHNQREGQFDIGLVDRIGRFQGGLFGSFKRVDLRNNGGGNLGQAALTLDYLFSLGRIGAFGTKSFLNNAVLGMRNAQFVSGTNADGTPRFSLAPNIFLENYLRVIDQVGLSTTIGLFGPTYLEANIGYLKSFGAADRPGGTARFVFPIGDRFAFTVEGGVNETLLGRSNAGRAVVGFQWGNLQRPREYTADSKYPVPADVPRVRYEVLTRTVRRGVSPPIADAGPDQIGVPAGTITLNGSNSRDPNGLPLTFQWVQEAGPSVSISGANTAIATFPAAAAQDYVFRLTVRNTDGQQASARTRVTTRSDARVQILFFIADPRTIQAGQSSTLSWRVLNADTVTITPGLGNVNPSNGTSSVSPIETTTYTLTARNAVSQESASTTVVVQRPEPTILACTATPMNITQGESATIVYQTQNATSVTITGLGNVAPSGSVVVTPSSTTSYTINASNQFAATSCSVTVQVTPGAVPRIVRFTAAPMSIQSGATSTLLFLVENAKSVTITPDVGKVDLAGTVDVKPTQTTTYTITATNDFGQATASTTVTVTAPPPNPTITSFTANPPTSPSPGSPVVLRCLANNANTVVISGFGPVNASGQLTVNPQTSTTYVCVAVGANGAQATASLTVPVTATGTGGAPPTLTVTSPNATCTPGSVVGGSISPTVCQTLVRQVTLNLSATSAAGNTPLTFSVTSRNTQAAVINPTSSMPIVQLAGLFGDYFFDVVITDSKGNMTTTAIDVQFVSTRVP